MAQVETDKSLIVNDIFVKIKPKYLSQFKNPKIEKNTN